MVLGEMNNNIPDDVVIAFKAKTAFMKSWKPASNPSNRDRLELYSLHKQAVAGDAPLPSSVNSSSASSVNSIETPAEKAKYNAWKSKAGLSPTEAMKRYVVECDRQISMYGTAATTTTDKPQNNPASTGSDGGKENTTTITNRGGSNNQVSMRTGGIGTKVGGNTQQPASGATTTGMNAAYQAATATAASTTLRGLAAIPLICAAASEDRQSYLRRLQTTATISSSATGGASAVASSSWWKRQEPLTAQPGTIVAIPEHILLFVASFVERISLAVNTVPTTKNGYNSVTSTDLIHPDASPAEDSDEYLGGSSSTNRGGSFSILSAILPPAAVIQSFLWPVHNCLLALWIEIILLHAILVGAFDCFWTVLWGSKSTGKTLPTVWNNHIRLACIQSMYTITDPHQPITARCVGLLLWPAHVMVQTISLITIDSDDNPAPSSTGGYYQQNQYYPGSATAAASNNNQPVLYNANIWTCLLYTVAITVTLWYWVSVVPFLSLFGLYLAFWVGGSCFALIELAGV